MLSEKVIIKNPTGLHLRPAGLFCKTAMQFECKILIEKKSRSECQCKKCIERTRSMYQKRRRGYDHL